MSEKGIESAAASSLRDRKNILDSKIGTIYTSLTSNFDVITPFYTFPKNAVAFRIYSYSIPYTWNNMHATWGSIMELSESAGGGIVSVNSTAGQYSVASYLAALETALNAASTNGITYTISSNPTTDILTFTASSGNFTFYFGTATSMAFQLGFDFSTTGIESTGGILISSYPHQILTSETPYIFIGSQFRWTLTPQLGQGIANYGIDSDSNLILAEIPINRTWGETLTPLGSFLGEFFPIGDPRENLTTIDRGIDIYLQHPQRTVSPIGGLRAPPLPPVPDTGTETVSGGILIPSYWTITFELHLT